MLRPLALAAVAALAACSYGESRAARQNEAVLHELRTPRGARLVDLRTTPYYGDDEDAPPQGYVTNARYVAPRGATANSVAEFYRRELRGHGWSCTRRSERVPRGTYVFLQCVRDHQLLGLNTDNMYAHPPQYELGIDADARALD